MGLAIAHRRLAIPDRGVPSAEHMRLILATVEEVTRAGGVPYIHCWGGIGRTGTVVGCYLVRRGMKGEEALQQIAAFRLGTPDGHRRSPETREQEHMVLTWSS